MPIPKRPVALGLAGFLLLASSPLALGQSAGEPSQPPQQEQTTRSKIEQMVTDYLQRALDAIQTTLGTMVPYKMPEVLPNGDIIIRRVPDGDQSRGGTGTPNSPATPPAAPSDKKGEEKT